MPWDPQKFISGEFIEPNDARYDELMERLTAETPPEARRKGHHYHLRSVFRMLFNYRAELEQCFQSLAGLYEASGVMFVAINRIGAMNKKILAELPLIDDLLGELISPEGKRFSISQLSKEFGYPNVDLFEIDMDWF